MTSECEVWNFLLHELPHDPFQHILSFAAFNDLSISFARVCRSWNSMVMNNNRLWSNLCRSYWTGKYVPLQYRKMLNESKATGQSSPAREAFKLSFTDRTRTIITVDELVSFRWYFRFREQAGTMWMTMDPWWNLNDDAFVLSNDSSDNDHDDEVTVNKPSCSSNEAIPKLAGLDSDESEDDDDSSLSPNGLGFSQNDSECKTEQKVLTEHERRLRRCTRVQFDRNGEMQWIQTHRTPMLYTQSMRWKFGGNIYCHNLFGSAVQVNQFPTKSVSRDPVTWGWIMQNMWVIYTSFPMPLMNYVVEQSQRILQYSQPDGLEFGDRKSWLAMDGTVDVEVMKKTVAKCKRLLHRE